MLEGGMQRVGMQLWERCIPRGKCCCTGSRRKRGEAKLVRGQASLRAAPKEGEERCSQTYCLSLARVSTGNRKKVGVCTLTWSLQT